MKGRHATMDWTVLHFRRVVDDCQTDKRTRRTRPCIRQVEGQNPIGTDCWISIGFRSLDFQIRAQKYIYIIHIYLVVAKGSSQRINKYRINTLRALSKRTSELQRFTRGYKFKSLPVSRCPWCAINSPRPRVILLRKDTGLRNGYIPQRRSHGEDFVSRHQTERHFEWIPIEKVAPYFFQFATNEIHQQQNIFVVSKWCFWLCVGSICVCARARTLNVTNIVFHLAKVFVRWN